jgi:uncharacterized protein YndB with AHSA1/START domain
MLAKSTVDAEVTLPSDREIRFTSILKHPPRLVFAAWTQPEHLSRWWGCEGGTLPVCEGDLRVGGAWRRVLRMADGSEHPFKGIYREIVPHQRLVYTECYDKPQIGSPEWLTTVTFEDLGGTTRLTHSILHRSREARDGHLRSGMEDGAQHQMRRLDEHVAEMETEQ